MHTVHQFENMSDPGDIRNAIAHMFSRPPKPKPPEDPVADVIAVLVTRIVEIDKRKAEAAALVKKRAHDRELARERVKRHRAKEKQRIEVLERMLGQSHGALRYMLTFKGGLKTVRTVRCTLHCPKGGFEHKGKSP